MTILKKVEVLETQNHLTLMNNGEVNNNHQNKYGKLKTTLSI